MLGMNQARRMSLWITTSGRSGLWTTSGCLPDAKLYAPCRGCFGACAFLYVLGRWCADCSLRVGAARKSSPCGVIRIGKREKVRPAQQKWPVFGVFGLAGRVFSRFGLDGAVVGRTFSRGDAMEVLLGELFRGLGGVDSYRWFHVCVLGRWCADCSLRVGAARKSSPCGVIRIGKREKVRPAQQKWPVFGVFGLAGRVFSRFGLDGAVVGRTFSRGDAMEVLLGELFRAVTTPDAPAISR